jgi:hypothetical protein
MPNQGLPRPAFSTLPGSDVSIVWDAGTLVGTAQLTAVLAVEPRAAGAVRAVATVCGEIDIATVTPLHAAALAVVGAAHPGRGQVTLLVLDLEGVTFLGCRALHFLQDICAQGIERGWAVELVAPRAAGPSRFLALASGHGWLPPGLVPAPQSAAAAVRLRPAPRRDAVTRLCHGRLHVPHPSRWFSRHSRSAA